MKKFLSLQVHDGSLMKSSRRRSQPLSATVGFLFTSAKLLISNAQTGEILGGVFAGAHAAELIHAVSVALAAKMTVEQLKEVIFAHPTFAESIGEALNR